MQSPWFLDWLIAQHVSVRRKKWIWNRFRLFSTTANCGRKTMQRAGTYSTTMDIHNLLIKLMVLLLLLLYNIYIHQDTYLHHSTQTNKPKIISVFVSVSCRAIFLVHMLAPYIIITQTHCLDVKTLNSHETIRVFGVIFIHI